MMRIENHRLIGDETVNVSQLTNLAGSLIKPEVIVIHYGVTDRLDSLVAAQKARGYWAHLSIDGSSAIGHKVVQALPFNMRGSHAGSSQWKNPVTGVARSHVNGFSVGIEISNPGPLIEGPDGQLRTVYNKTWPADDAIKARHKNAPSPPTWNHWAKYSDQELDICVGVCRLLRETYPSIVDVVGHDDISPGRKYDPGPAFPMDWLRAKVFGGAA